MMLAKELVLTGNQKKARAITARAFLLPQRTKVFDGSQEVVPNPT